MDDDLVLLYLFLKQMQWIEVLLVEVAHYLLDLNLYNTSREPNVQGSHITGSTKSQIYTALPFFPKEAVTET